MSVFCVFWVLSNFFLIGIQVNESSTCKFFVNDRNIGMKRRFPLMSSDDNAGLTRYFSTIHRLQLWCLTFMFLHSGNVYGKLAYCQLESIWITDHDLRRCESFDLHGIEKNTSDNRFMQKCVVTFTTVNKKIFFWNFIKVKREGVINIS